MKTLKNLYYKRHNYIEYATQFWEEGELDRVKSLISHRNSNNEVILPACQYAWIG